jgi:alpha-L-rhamnosidase
VKAATPRGEGRAKVESFTDLTGTVLRIGLIGSGTTEVRLKSS